MAFLNNLVSFNSAILLWAIATELSGPLWLGLHGDAEGKRAFYVWPLIHLIVLIILIVAEVKVLFS